MNAHNKLQMILEDPGFAPNIIMNRLLPAQEGKFADFPENLDSKLINALKRRGIDKLYTHQAEVWRHTQEGKNVVVVTPTASGKTLCYNLPCINALLSDDSARCLYLFPTKALSQDQQSELNDLTAVNWSGAKEDGSWPPSGNSGASFFEFNIKVATYDGDTPESLRISARETGRIIISNPDMLHTGILPNHPKWVKFFSRLKFVVVDEAHAYRGVFGSHVANVIRRLRRIAAFYGAKPRFILCSATIGNPVELARSLIGEEVVLVDNNGAPGGEKRIILYNPPLVDAVQGIRRSVVTESRRWMIALLQADIKTILFAHSRIRTEVAASYVNEDLKNIYTGNSGIRVEAYRGGLLPNERREIEKGLRDGSIHGVVSTNALELGIDIGGLDASIVAGFPGSYNSFWQQSGRAGRRGGTSISVFIASIAPIDQFIMNDPRWFFRKSAEEARIDPDNPYILTDHVKCACFELPFIDEQLAIKNEQLTGGYGENVLDVLEYLEEAGIVRHAGGRWHWADRSYPAEGVSLRSAGADNVVIIDLTNGRNTVIGEMDRPSAKEMIFVNAVYIHRGRQYLVEELDIENRKCLVREADVNYFTDGLVKTDIKVLTEDERWKVGDRELGIGSKEERTDLETQNNLSDRAFNSLSVNTCSSFSTSYCLELVLSDVLVRTQVTKFKKLRFRTHENIGFGNIDLPEEEKQTRSIALIFPPESTGGKLLAEKDEQFIGEALSGTGYLFRNIAPVYLLCDPHDLGIAGRVRDPHFGYPALYVYDKYPGGTGLTESLARNIEPLLRAINETISRCPCKSGCPSCVGPGGNKAAVREFLNGILFKV
ncbi:MAG: DEAD/DEAH box helicase [Treponema sp.]|jgi:DEAD/DEAH box helicase domain-containing protein|nr:DEAD/DEAH box helicase [Treponema sp.]